MRLIISTTAGSQPDTIARLITQKMSEQFGQPVIMENRPGGMSTLATVAAAKANPDGHTIMYVLPNFAIHAAQQLSPAQDALKEFAGVGHIGISTNLLVVTPTLGVKTVDEFVALAKARQGKLIYASSATGSASHLSGVRFNLIAGVKAVQVAFKGGPDSTIEVLAGRGHYTVGTMGVLLPFIKEGKLVALALTSPQRTPVLPDVPTLGELYAEFKRPETSHGMLAPAGTPRAIRELLSKELARILELPDIKARLLSFAYTPAHAGPDAYEKILREQIVTLTKVITDAGLRGK